MDIITVVMIIMTQLMTSMKNHLCDYCVTFGCIVASLRPVSKLLKTAVTSSNSLSVSMSGLFVMLVHTLTLINNLIQRLSLLLLPKTKQKTVLRTDTGKRTNSLFNRGKVSSASSGKPSIKKSQKLFWMMKLAQKSQKLPPKSDYLIPKWMNFYWKE